MSKAKNKTNKITITTDYMDLAIMVDLLKYAGAKLLVIPLDMDALKGDAIENLELTGRMANYVKKLADENNLEDVAELAKALGPIEEITKNPNIGKGTAMSLYFRLLEYQYEKVPKELRLPFLVDFYNANIKAMKEGRGKTHCDINIDYKKEEETENE